MTQLPTPQRSPEVAAFIDELRTHPAAQDPARGRLLFALDATASREPTWDRACKIQGEMFEATAGIGSLEIQLIYYRGYSECRASRWITTAAELHRAMLSVACAGGKTQIERVLAHAIRATRAQKVGAVIFIGDAMEERLDQLCHLAGELGSLKTPLFMFHELNADSPEAGPAFAELARLSKGFSLSFDEASVEHLKLLLGAVALYATGNRGALEDYARRSGSGEVLRLTHQLRGSR